jgi:hypothetical protein
MFVMENPSVTITVVADSPQKPWENRLNIATNHDFLFKKKKLLVWCHDYIT